MTDPDLSLITPVTNRRTSSRPGPSGPGETSSRPGPPHVGRLTKGLRWVPWGALGESVHLSGVPPTLRSRRDLLHLEDVGSCAVSTEVSNEWHGRPLTGEAASLPTTDGPGEPRQVQTWVSTEKEGCEVAGLGVALQSRVWYLELLDLLPSKVFA